jgi:hypothetical protein
MEYTLTMIEHSRQEVSHGPHPDKVLTLLAEAKQGHYAKTAELVQ